MKLQRVVTLDVEGVLMPEVWVEVAELTGIEGLRRTTQDEPDYDVLMAHRLGLLEEHDLDMEAVSQVLREIQPLDGAPDFLDELRSRYQVILLSDTFEQFATAMMPHLNMPTIFCHSLNIEDNRITGYQLRTTDHKTKTVKALRELNFHVTSSGDSFNDLGMLNAANAGAFFSAPDHIVQTHNHLASFSAYQDLIEWIDQQG